MQTVPWLAHLSQVTCRKFPGSCSEEQRWNLQLRMTYVHSSSQESLCFVNLLCPALRGGSLYTQNSFIPVKGIYLNFLMMPPAIEEMMPVRCFSPLRKKIWGTIYDIDGVSVHKQSKLVSLFKAQDSNLNFPTGYAFMSLNLNGSGDIE